MLFDDVGVPLDDAQRRLVNASTTAYVSGVAHDIGYHTLVRTGEGLGAGTFGLVVDSEGDPILDVDDVPEISRYADFTSLMEVEGELVALTQLGGVPGALYVTELTVDGATGELTAVSTEPLLTADGLFNPQSGSITPWGSHLATERIHDVGGLTRPADGRAWEEHTLVSQLGSALPFLRHHGIDVFADTDQDGEPDDLTIDDVRATMNPYDHGYPIEISGAGGGGYTLQRHGAMGRAALEKVLVMPDDRTVYLTDEDINGALFLFLATTAGDLSEGELFAARWLQTSGPGEGAGEATLDWVSLGVASDADVDAVLAKNPAFSDLFETADPLRVDHDEDDKTPPIIDGSCPKGFRPSSGTGVELECLALVKGMELAASRLEPTRYASWLEATAELQSAEGLAHDPVTNTLFLAVGAVERGMEAGHRTWDVGGNNDIRAQRNRCGVVYAVDLAKSARVRSEFAGETLRPLLDGVPTTYPSESSFAGNTCSISFPANPDELAFVPGYDTLFVGEDSTTGHLSDAVWALEVSSGRLDRVLTTPYGSEVASLDFRPNLAGHGYLTVVVQHPYGETDTEQLKAPADAEAYVGYLGPFPAMD